MAKTAMLQELARLGAISRAQELRAELAQLEKAFPGISSTRGRRGAGAAAAGETQPRKRRKMSAAARRKIAEAQRRRWAKHKAEKA